MPLTVTILFMIGLESWVGPKSNVVHLQINP